MANTIFIGRVQTVSSLTAGTVKSDAGVTVNYSDSTLTTRGVALSLGEYVSGTYDGATLTNVCSLTALYAQGLTDANAENELTEVSVKAKLQIANCCAQKQAQKDVDEKVKGKDGCPELVADSKLMRNLVKSICGIVPEGETISGNQATYQVVITGIGNPLSSMALTIDIGDASYAVSVDNIPTRTGSVVAQEMADYINSLYPDDYSYYAEASGANIIISGSDFDDDNGTSVVVGVINGTVLSQTTLVMSGGTEEVLQGENPITNQEIQVVLDKLNSLCQLPCDKIFSSN